MDISVWTLYFALKETEKGEQKNVLIIVAVLLKLFKAFLLGYH